MSARQTVSSVLAIYAHPDDAEASVGGTLAQFAEVGAVTRVVVCARGDKGSSDPTIDTAVLTAERRAEALAAAAVLGVHATQFLDIPDGAIDARDPTFVRELVRVIRMTKPDIVCCPDPTAVFFGDSYINHRDHREVGWAVIDAVAPAAANPHYFPELLTDGLDAHTVREVYLSGTLEPNEYVDITSTLERKIDAMFEHRSQLGEVDADFRAFLVQRAAETGRAAGLGAAEAFRRVRVSA
ncbi:MAG: PIG-L deacetylase family protein [Acidimicrobiia bacterium]